MRHGPCAVLVLATLLAGCSAGGEKLSPAQYGFGLHVAPGFQIGEGSATIHPTAAYMRPVFGGVDGEQDNMLRLGAQARVPVGGASGAGWWLGGEATLGRRWTSYDFAGIPSETTNGWALLAMAGRPFAETSLGTFHGYAAAGVAKWGGSGPHVRFGVDLQPAFLRR